MKSTSIQSRRQSIATSLQQTRASTLDLLAQIDPAFFCHQAHGEFSPIGWHFGHIAFTEAYWILEHLGEREPIYTQYQRLFAADGLPKHERQNLPSIAVIQEYLADVRQKVLNYLATATIAQHERLWRWLIQHESQHLEIITFIWQLHLHQHSYKTRLINFAQLRSPFDAADASTIVESTSMLKVEAGTFIMGSNAIEAMDNERPAHKTYLDTYYIDRAPVTCEQFYQFIVNGGYQKSQYWSETGWQWLQNTPVSQPLYWSDNLDWANHPVVGISYYEAEAYARYLDRRLPTEAEWSKASAGADLNCNHRRLIGHTSSVETYPGSKYDCYDMLGNVWEWTASWFVGYQGFESYPYDGYSQVYFDGQHRVLKGGSWATSSSALRTSFRNWYHPGVRQIFAGFRCASDTKA